MQKFLVCVQNVWPLGLGIINFLIFVPLPLQIPHTKMTNNTPGQKKTDSNRSPELIVMGKNIISFWDNYHVFLCKAFYRHRLQLLDQWQSIWHYHPSASEKKNVHRGFKSWYIYIQGRWKVFHIGVARLIEGGMLNKIGLVLMMLFYDMSNYCISMVIKREELIST